MYVNMLGCLDFMDEIGMFGVSDGMELHMIIGWNENLMYEMKVVVVVWETWNVYVLGIIPWGSWRDLMVVCSVYIKIWIQVRIASRNSEGSVSLR